MQPIVYLTVWRRRKKSQEALRPPAKRSRVAARPELPKEGILLSMIPREVAVQECD